MRRAPQQTVVCCKLRTKTLSHSFPKYRWRGRRFCSRTMVFVGDSLSKFTTFRPVLLYLDWNMAIMPLLLCGLYNVKMRPGQASDRWVLEDLVIVIVKAWPPLHKTGHLPTTFWILWPLSAWYGCAESSRDAHYLSVSYEFLNFSCTCILPVCLSVRWGSGVGWMRRHADCWLACSRDWSTW